MTDTKTMVSALNVIADELQAMEGTIQAQCVRDAAVKLADMHKTIDQLENENNNLLRTNVYISDINKQLLAGNVPDGWKLVPIEPTEEMREAFHIANEEYENGRGWSPDHQWNAMLSAAPEQLLKDGE